MGISAYLVLYAANPQIMDLYNVLEHWFKLTPLGELSCVYTTAKRSGGRYKYYMQM